MANKKLKDCFERIVMEHKLENKYHKKKQLKEEIKSFSIKLKIS